MAHIVLLGTCDTKLSELLYLRSQILQTENVRVTLIDVGNTDTDHSDIDIRSKELRDRYGEQGSSEMSSRSKGVEIMAHCATRAVRELCDAGEIHGIIAAGGSGGTSLASEVMRNALPIGFPKMIVSTIASGDTGPIIEETDITMMYSVVDIAGLNELLRTILSNAAAAISGMALSYAPRRRSSTHPKKRVGITMFGVTTPAVGHIRRHLETLYNVECYIFHATGHGGKALERLVREGSLDGVLDLTTTEICDLHTGGNMSAGPHRLEAAAEAGIPNIISLGATDMSNFGPKDSVPECYKGRQLYEHNSLVTLMRTSREEAEKIGSYIVKKLKAHTKRPDMVEVWLPKGGVSSISTPGAVFADPTVDAALFRTVRDGLSGTDIKVIEDDRAINDEGFAIAIANALGRKFGSAYA
jgi:uncharacterized protein (UPF0261 family)